MAKVIEFVTDDFVEKCVAENPKPMNELGEFVYYRTYSRWLPNKGRREYWHETCKRAINYNMTLAYLHIKKIGLKPKMNEMKKEAKSLYESMYNVRQFLSGRSLWVAGADNDLAFKYPMSNYNCSFLNIEKWEDLDDLFYNLMIGVGVGFKCTKKMAQQLPPIRTNVNLIHSNYKPLPKSQRLEESQIIVLDNGFAKIYVGDSKEAWCSALRLYLEILTKKQYEEIHTVKITYNSIRPKGERLRTFGGKASGHESLLKMFEGFDKVLKNQIDPSLEPIVTNEKGYGQVRPVHILDFGNLIGQNVVVGGVRRTAEIFLFDHDDYECLLAKYGINGFWKEEQFQHHEEVKKCLIQNGYEPPAWFDEIGKRHYDESINGKQPYNFGRSLDHRRMSNNSVAFKKKPTRQQHHLQFMLLQTEGEPCFVNLEEAHRRRGGFNDIDDIGLNPCAEILLAKYGLCNLTTINFVAFVKGDEKTGYKLDIQGLINAQRLSARAGIRMTCTELELKHWSDTQLRDRLIGCSCTGVKDAMELCGYSQEQEKELLAMLGEVARREAQSYSHELRIACPLLSTTVKPEGTLSQLAGGSKIKGGVSSGLHYSHSPYYIRRIRINATDPLAQAAIQLGWTVNPEVGTVGDTYEEQMKNASTYVIDFPAQSGSSRTKDDISVEEQFETYKNFQAFYTDHNSSNTITINTSKNEWAKAEQIVWDMWDSFVGVSFLQLDGGTYKLAPYEKISKEQFEELKAKMKPFDPQLLQLLEQEEIEYDIGQESCESGICPIR